MKNNENLRRADEIMRQMKKIEGLRPVPIPAVVIQQGAPKPVWKRNYE